MAATRTRRLKAIVLSRTKLREQDLIITALAESGEQIRAVAKGARKSGGRLASRCDLFCESDFLLARGRGQLEIVSEASLCDAHSSIRTDFDRMTAASAICEIARLMCYEDSSDPYLYPICSAALSAAERTNTRAALDTLVSAFTFKLLAHGGWWPQLKHCVLCEDESPDFFSASLGGLVCASCARDSEGAEYITELQRAWMEALLAQTFDELLSVHPDQQTAQWLIGCARAWAETHIDARLRSFELLCVL